MVESKVFKVVINSLSATQQKEFIQIVELCCRRASLDGAYIISD